MKEKTGILSEGSTSESGERSASLQLVRREALDNTAIALKSVIRQQQVTRSYGAQCEDNILIAKKDMVDAMVNLAIASSDGSHSRTKSILSEYGLEDMV